MALSNTTNTTLTTFAQILGAQAVGDEMDSRMGFTWNGGSNIARFKSNKPVAALLALSQKMVLSDEGRKAKALPDSEVILFNQLFDSYISTITSLSDVERRKWIDLLFRFVFYVRNLRGVGKRYKLGFQYLMDKCITHYPEIVGLCFHLIPLYGCFRDLNSLIIRLNTRPLIKYRAVMVYVNALTKDLSVALNTDYHSLSHSDLKDRVETLNAKLKTLTVADLKQFLTGKTFSLAAKYIPNTGKKDDEIRPLIVDWLLFGGKLSDLSISNVELFKRRSNFGDRLLRKICTLLRQCIRIVEHNMCGSTTRTWADIDLAITPSGATTKYTTAFSNEMCARDRYGPMQLKYANTGDRYPNDPDRVACRTATLVAAAEGKLKGAQTDILKFSHLVWSYIEEGSPAGYSNDYNNSFHLSSKLTSATRQVVAAQWLDLEAKIKAAIDDVWTARQVAYREACEAGEHPPKPVDPRAILWVVDNSGSMFSYNVGADAIGLGVLGSRMSLIPNVFITFSEKPTVVKIPPGGDVFTWFLAVANTHWGGSTNMEATYKLCLDLIVRSGMTGQEFSIGVLTDGQFNSMLHLPRVSRGHCSPRNFQKTILTAMGKDFKQAKVTLPRLIFWNLNCDSPGFPADSDTPGVQLVAGRSQTLMLSVFTSDFTYEVDPDTGEVRATVDPETSFLTTLSDPIFDPVSEAVYQSHFFM